MTTATAAPDRERRPMTIDDSRRLHDYAARIRDELALLELAGCGDTEHARSLRDVRRRVIDAIAAARTARAELEAQRAVDDHETRDRQAERERQREAEIGAAVTFLDALLSGHIIPRDDVLRRADEAGIDTAALLAAASQLGVVQLAGYVGGRIRHTSPRAWAPRAMVFAAGWSQEDVSLT